MYLVSIYFDEKTNQIIQKYINQVAKATGNRLMLERQVPPHITISAFETKNEERVVERLTKLVDDMKCGSVKWVSVGQFLPYVTYITPVLNEYLHSLGEQIYNCVRTVEETEVSLYYRPFQWFPHTTIGKQLSSEEMKKAFDVLQKTFVPFEGTVVKIGLAKAKPYRDVFVKTF